MKVIESQDLQLTKSAFLRHFAGYRRQGLSLHKSFLSVESICSQLGCRNYYLNFESFKSALYREKLDIS